MSVRLLFGTAALVALAGCDGFDFDLRDRGGGFDTSNAAASATQNRPTPDTRGVISYPTYQVAVAQRGDTVALLAQRVGLPAGEVASYNGLSDATALREGEIIALPRRVAEPLPGSGGALDVSAIATQAIDQAPGGAVTTAPLPGGTEPVRHQVKRGETAYTIARLYNVSPRALAEWNGLGPDLAVREGAFLMIPPASAAPAAPSIDDSLPGDGSETPVPPSGEKPLPDDDAAKPVTPADVPAAPVLTTSKPAGKLAMPVQGSIIREYQKKKNDGIDIGAPAGTAVKAAADGTVAAITQDTDKVTIVVVRHANNLLTVYAGIEGLTVKKGDSVSRGQTLGKVRAGSPSFLHFEVREGFESVDPVPYLN